MSKYVNNQPKDFIKSLQIIHWVLVLGVLVLAAYVYISGKSLMYFSYEDDKAFLYMAILIAFIGNLASKFMYAKLLKKIDLKDELIQKATKFSTAHIFRLAMLEFPALMCIIFVLQSNNTFYFILSGVLFFMMVAVYPTKAKFANDVPLTDKEKTILEKL